MNNANPYLSHLPITHQPGQALVTTDRTLAPLLRVQHITTLAINERNQTVFYGMAQVATELQRQIGLIAKKGGVTPEERIHLNSLLLACMVELQAANVHLNTQLIGFLSRSRKE